MEPAKIPFPLPTNTHAVENGPPKTPPWWFLLGYYNRQVQLWDRIIGLLKKKSSKRGHNLMRFCSIGFQRHATMSFTVYSSHYNCLLVPQVSATKMAHHPRASWSWCPFASFPEPLSLPGFEHVPHHKVPGAQVTRVWVAWFPNMLHLKNDVCQDDVSTTNRSIHAEVNHDWHI